MRVPILGYPGYEIDERGGVYNKNGLLLKPAYRKGRAPYQRVALYKGGKPKWFAVHRLVAQHFIPNPNGYKYVLHLDDNPNNPIATNLKWGTNSENIKDAWDKRIKKEGHKPSPIRGGNHPMAVPVAIIHKETDKIKHFDSIRDLQNYLGITTTVSIHQAIRKPTRTVKGYYIIKTL